MNKFSRIALSALIAGFAAIASIQTIRAGEPGNASAAPQKSPLEELVPYVGGEWRIDGAWSDGRPLKARETFEWGIGKKFIVCKTFVGKPEGGEYQRYETIFGVQDGKLTAWGFVFDGHADISEYTVEGKKLSTTKPMRAAEGAASTSTLHQSIELIDANKIRWLVAIETDGKIEQIMDGTWVRTGSANARN